MGMGQSWYTPIEIVNKLPIMRTIIISSENLQGDLKIVSRKLCNTNIISNSTIGKYKSDYNKIYNFPEKTFPRELSDIARENLRKFLSADFSVYEALQKLRFETLCCDYEQLAAQIHAESADVLQLQSAIQALKADLKAAALHNAELMGRIAMSERLTVWQQEELEQRRNQIFVAGKAIGKAEATAIQERERRLDTERRLGTIPN
jgi:hypothetical protein